MSRTRYAYEEGIERLNEVISREVRGWFKAQCQMTESRFFLYFRRAREHESIGDLSIATEAPSEE